MSYGSVVKKGVRDSRGNVDIIDDRKITKQALAGQHRMCPKWINRNRIRTWAKASVNGNLTYDEVGIFA